MVKLPWLLHMISKAINQHLKNPDQSTFLNRKIRNFPRIRQGLLISADLILFVMEYRRKGLKSAVFQAISIPLIFTALNKTWDLGEKYVIKKFFKKP